jgi:hypothetical protein
VWLARECCKIISQSHQQIQARALIEELVVDKQGLHGRIEALDWEVANWKARVDDVKRRTYDIKGQSIQELFLRLEEEKVSWEECVKAIESKYCLFKFFPLSRKRCVLCIKILMHHFLGLDKKAF